MTGDLENKRSRRLQRAISATYLWHLATGMRGAFRFLDWQDRGSLRTTMQLLLETLANRAPEASSSIILVEDPNLELGCYALSTIVDRSSSA